MNIEVKQPVGAIRGAPQYRAGGNRSVARLRALAFDPIGELVKQYRKLEVELEHQEKLRSGAVQEMTSSGKVRAYRPDVHQQIYDRLINISEKLLRYGYGRVSETTIIDSASKPSFVVNLTKKGEQYVVSSPDETPQLELDEDFYDQSP